jgi:hypothetical protein
LLGLAFSKESRSQAQKSSEISEETRRSASQQQRDAFQQ